MKSHLEAPILIQSSSQLSHLRAQVERALPPHSIIGITSSSEKDGKVQICRGLAQSLSRSGYRALYLDAESVLAPVAKTSPACSELSFEQLADSARASGGVHPSFLSLRDPQSYDDVSQQSINRAVETLRTKFDYVVINLQTGIISAFSKSLLESCDAALVTLRLKRRLQSTDIKLSRLLDALGSRFLGVIAVESDFCDRDYTVDEYQDANNALHSHVSMGDNMRAVINSTT